MIAEIKFTENAETSFLKLPLHIRKKAKRQLKRLLENPRHPSLHIKKMQSVEKFEGRIDYHYRFTFIIEDNILWILSLGPHDSGLGKK